jgi:flagellar protein FliO/FliZ
MRSLRPWLVALVFSGCLGLTVQAAEEVIFPRSAGSGRTTEPARTSVPGAATVFVVAACAGVGGWLLWQGRRRMKGGPAADGRKLTVAETRSLGSRQYLVVAAYGEKKYLLGVCPGRINLLTSLEDDIPKAP